MTNVQKCLSQYMENNVLENIAIRNYTPNMNESRGLGYLYVDENYSQTGELFPKGSDAIEKRHP